MLSEHKHCGNAATNSNSEKARSRMVASLRGSVVRGQRKMIKYCAHLGCWISPCYGPFSLGARFETYEPFISLIFQIVSGRDKQLRLNPRIRRFACIWKQPYQIKIAFLTKLMQIKAGNACYHSVQNFLSYSLLSKIVKFKIHRPAVGREMWSRAVSEEHRLGAFENRVLRRIFVPQRDEVTGAEKTK